MKPHLHGNVSAKKFGGKPEDYQEIHDFLDSTKACHADMRHRAILHNSMGPFIAEKVFGITIVNSEGKTVSVRDVAELHIIDDMGRIPSLSDYLHGMPFYDWLGKPKKEVKEISFDQLEAKELGTDSVTSERLKEAMKLKEQQYRNGIVDPKNAILD